MSRSIPGETLETRKCKRDLRDWVQSGEFLGNRVGLEFNVLQF